MNHYNSTRDVRVHYILQMAVSISLLVSRKKPNILFTFTDLFILVFKTGFITERFFTATLVDAGLGTDLGAVRPTSSVTPPSCRAENKALRSLCRPPSPHLARTSFSYTWITRSTFLNSTNTTFIYLK